MDRLEELRTLYQERKLAEARELHEEHLACSDPEWHWIGSLVYWHIGNYRLARLATMNGLDLKPQGELRLKFLYHLGITEEQLGEFGAAINRLESCLDELPAYVSLEAVMRGVVLYNLGIAHYNRNADGVPRAIDYFEQAAEEMRREGLREAMVACLQNLAWAYCDIGQAALAFKAVNEAAPLCMSEDQRLLQRITTAYQLLVAGNPSGSLALIEPLVRLVDGSPAFIFALCVNALVGLALRRNDRNALTSARGMAQLALTAASERSSEPRCWTTANRVYQRVQAAIREQNRGA